MTTDHGDEADREESAVPELFRPSTKRSIVIATNDQFLAVLGRTNDAKSLQDMRQAFVALEAVASKCKLAMSELFRLATQRLEVERKLGAILTQTVRIGRPRKVSPEATFSADATLPPDLPRQEAAKYQKLAAIPAEVFDRYLRESESNERLPTSAGARRFAAPPKRRPAKGRSTRSRGAESSVPPQVLDLVRRIMDPIDMSVGATKVGARRTISASATDLADQLAGDVFVSDCQDPATMLKHLMRQRNKGKVDQAVVVLPAEVWAPWFADLKEGWTVCLLRDVQVDGVGCVVAHTGARAGAFRVATSELGAVLCGCG